MKFSPVGQVLSDSATAADASSCTVLLLHGTRPTGAEWLGKKCHRHISKIICVSASDLWSHCALSMSGSAVLARECQFLATCWRAEGNNSSDRMRLWIRPSTMLVELRGEHLGSQRWLSEECVPFHPSGTDQCTQKTWPC